MTLEALIVWWKGFKPRRRLRGDTEVLFANCSSKWLITRTSLPDGSQARSQARSRSSSLYFSNVCRLSSLARVGALGVACLDTDTDTQSIGNLEGSELYSLCMLGYVRGGTQQNLYLPYREGARVPAAFAPSMSERGRKLRKKVDPA